MTDLPFLPPADAVLDIPVPPSVNRTRRVNWKARPAVEKWEKQVDSWLTYTGQFRKAKKAKPNGPYELTVILSDALCNTDPDNILKHAIDYLRRVELITNDSPKYARRLVVEWGDAPKGCRLILRPCEAMIP